MSTKRFATGGHITTPIPSSFFESMSCDYTVPKDIDALLAFHRSVFGDLRMEDGAGGDGAGSGTGGDAAGAGAGAADAGSGGSGTGDTGSGAQEPPAWNPDAWDGKVESLPKAAQKLIADKRTAEGDERVSKKTLEQIAKLLNPDSDEKPDAAKLAADIQAKDATIRDLTIRSALTDALHTNNAKPIARAAILGDEILKDLDPTADDFTSKVDAAVKAYIEKNPELKAVQAAGSSSADHAGGSGEGASNRPKSLGDAIAPHYAKA